MRGLPRDHWSSCSTQSLRYSSAALHIRRASHMAWQTSSWYSYITYALSVKLRVAGCEMHNPQSIALKHNGFDVQIMHFCLKNFERNFVQSIKHIIMLVNILRSSRFKWVGTQEEVRSKRNVYWIEIDYEWIWNEFRWLPIWFTNTQWSIYIVLRGRLIRIDIVWVMCVFGVA